MSCEKTQKTEINSFVSTISPHCLAHRRLRLDYHQRLRVLRSLYLHFPFSRFVSSQLHAIRRLHVSSSILHQSQQFEHHSHPPHLRREPRFPSLLPSFAGHSTALPAPKRADVPRSLPNSRELQEPHDCDLHREANPRLLRFFIG